VGSGWEASCAVTDDLRVIVDADADPLVRELKRAGVEVRGFGGVVSSQSRGARAFSAAVDKQKESLRGLGRITKTASLAIGTGLVLAIGSAIKVGAEFESEMARVQAVTGASGKEMDQLRKLAIKLGADTKFSAGEAAEAMYELASAGFNVQQTSRALPGTLSLAAASGIELAAAAEISSNALRGFGLQTSQSTHVADVLAKSVNSSSVEMDDLQLSLKYIGPVAKATGETFEQMIAAVSLMGNAGIKGEQAGTTLRAGLIRLVKPTKQVNEGLGELGLRAGDLYGPKGLLPLPQLVGKLQAGMDGLSQAQKSAALASIFGNEAVAGMLTVVDAGPAKLARLTKAFENSDGASAKAAKTMNDTVKGAFEELTGSVETVEIELYQHFQQPLKEALQEGTEIVNTEGKHLQDALGEAMSSPQFKRGDIGDKVEILVNTIGDELDRSDLPEQLGDGMIQAFNWALPRMAEAAGHGAITVAKAFVHGFIESDELGRIVIGAWLFSKLGGFAALRAAGVLAGAEVSTGMAAGITGGAAAGGSAAGGAVAGGLLGKLKGIRWARFGGIGLGLALADATLNEFSRRTQEKSSDLGEALHAMEGPKPFGVDAFGALSKAPVVGGMLSLNDSEVAARNISAQYDELLEKRVRLSKATEESLRDQMQELDLTTEQREQYEQMLALIHGGRDLNVAVNLGVDPQQLQTAKQAFDILHKGFLTSLADIEKVGGRNEQLIKSMGLGSADARRLVGQNYREMATAVEQAMARSDIPIKSGFGRWKQLLRNAQLVTGQDPFGIAKGFANSWKNAGEINKTQRRNAIRDLGKMPPEARQKAYDTMVEFGRGLVRKQVIPQQDLRDFVSKALTHFDDLKTGSAKRSGDTATTVAKNIGLMAGAVLDGLGIVSGETNKALKAFNAKPVAVQIKTGAEAVGSIVGAISGLARQSGGIVPGSGDGDKVRRVVPDGTFIMNREATAAFGLARGGNVPVVLEPGEYEFPPHEVAKIGRGRLEAMNAAVPRFQEGGSVELQKGGGARKGVSITGTDWSGRELGQNALNLVMKAADAYVSSHKPKGGAGYSGPAFGPTGTSTYMGVLMATWVRQALEYGAAHGSGNPQPTSGYRSHAQNVAEGRDYFSEHEKTQYPGGAVDFGGMVDPASLPLKMAVVNATRGFKYPLLAPAGFRDDGHASGTGHMLGGLVKALSAGGPVPPSDGELVGASYYGGPTDHVSGTVGAAGVSLPGKMSFAELAMGKALGGLPFHTKLKIGYNGKSVVAEKLDIGLGGDDVGGKNRAIDLWYETANAIGMPGTAVVKVAPADGATTKADERVPAVYHGVRTDSLEFGSMPKSLPGVEKELRQRRAELPRYRSAAATAQKEGKPKIEHAIRANITALESRVKQLDHERAKLRREIAKKRVTRRMAKSLQKITGAESLIEAAQAQYAKRSQDAEQLVALEPTQPILASNATDAQREASEKAYVARLTDYITNREEPAYLSVLGSEAKWRNTVLDAESLAAGKAPNGPIGGMEGAFEDRLAKLRQDIGWISNMAGTHSGKWWHDHPKELKHLHEMTAKLPLLRFKEQEVAKALTKTREAFYPGGAVITDPKPPRPGTGSFEGFLADVQGTHWPDQHERLAALPTTRVAGAFGGAIWDTQEAIEGLGLRIAEAAASIAGSGGGETENAALTAAKEAMALQDKQNLALSQGETRVFGEMFRELGGRDLPYLGAYMQGTGGLRVGQTGFALLHRDEMVVPDTKGPAGSQLAGTATSSHEVNVYVDGDVGPLLGKIRAEVDGKLAKVNAQMGGDARRRLNAPGRF
jgi:TP901 family phage tail tape measure protein